MRKRLPCDGYEIVVEDELRNKLYDLVTDVADRLLYDIGKNFCVDDILLAFINALKYRCNICIERDKIKDGVIPEKICPRCEDCDEAELRDNKWYCKDCNAMCNEISRCPWN